jgi:predicted alpha/beta-hydrolase family hydrolase
MKAASANWNISAGNDVTIAVYDAAQAPEARAVFVFAHGAGGDMNDRAVAAMSAALRERGIGTVRFNFFYRARKSGRPDPMPRLIACWTAVLAKVRTELDPRTLIVGGRSMGGRAASMAVADGQPCNGLLLLAYPLHPPGQPQKLRDAHLKAIRVPVMCISGTRDAFCERPLMEDVLSKLGRNWRMHWLDEADHGFHVLKSSGRTDQDVVAEAADAVVRWDVIRRAGE